MQTLRHLQKRFCTLLAQAFINTARKIYEKIETGVFDVSNEVRNCCIFRCAFLPLVVIVPEPCTAAAREGRAKMLTRQCLVLHTVLRHQGGLWCGRLWRCQPEYWRSRACQERLLRLIALRHRNSASFQLFRRHNRKVHVVLDWHFSFIPICTCGTEMGFPLRIGCTISRPLG